MTRLLMSVFSLSLITTGCSNDNNVVDNDLKTINIATQSNISIDTKDLNMIESFEDVIFYSSLSEEDLLDYEIDIINMSYDEFEKNTLEASFLEAIGLDAELQINNFSDVVDYFTVALNFMGKEISSTSEGAFKIDVPEIETLKLDGRDVEVSELTVDFLGKQTITLVPVENGFITITVISDYNDYPEEVIDEILATIYAK